MQQIATDVAAIALLAVTAACTAREEASQPTPIADAPASVTVTATDYAFTAPDTIEAGFTTFRLVNRGGQLHMAQLIKLEGGRTLDDFLVAYDEAFRTKGPRPEWAKRLGGPGAAVPGTHANSTQFLEPGSYAWICLMNLPDGIPHVVKAGMAKPFTVRPRRSAPQAAPAASAVIRMVEYAFVVGAPLTPGRHVIRVENSGTEPHELGLIKLAPGKTMQDFERWLQNPTAASPASSVAGVASMAPGTEAYFEVELTAGDYVLLCFVTAPDGRSHIEHGMIQPIRIA